MASKSLKKVRRTQKLGQDRLITLMDKQGREIHHQDTIIERIEQFYTELYDSQQSTIIHTDPTEVPEITSWVVEAATSNDHINTETSKLYTKCFSETREDTRRKPVTRASWVLKRILNDRPHPCRKPTEREVQRI